MIKAPGPNGTLTEWLAYIESIHPASIDMGLNRIQTVGKNLGLLPDEGWPCPVVTIAGTNGKGTTVKTLSTLLHTLGYQVGAYTSPHLVHFSERVEINQQAVSDEAFIEAFVAVEHARVELNHTLTYFEFTTLAALWIFKSAPLDALVLEIGLGGRLDAVNMINPDISVITTIGLDHTEFLGDNLDQIAEEKAGIIRENKPVIIGQGAYRAHLMNIAEAKKAQIYLRGRDFDDVAIQGKHTKMVTLFPDSVQLAIQALKLLAPKLHLSEARCQALYHDFPLVRLLGRFQPVEINNVNWLVDVAHNAHAADWLAEQLNDLPKVVNTHIVWCSFADKDIEGIITAFLNKLSQTEGAQTAWYIGALAHPRTAFKTALEKMNTDILKRKVSRSDVCSTFEQALNQAYNQAKPGDRVVVFGSFQAVHEALAFIDKVKV